MPLSPLIAKALLFGTISLLLEQGLASAQQLPVTPESFVDSDRDGLSDSLEQRLLEQFVPQFMMARNDCSVSPAEFASGVLAPQVEADNGTIYGQVSPGKISAGGSAFVEIHYYHLWRKDCGGHGHPLDTEHVAVLVRVPDAGLTTATWKAAYWYAAAHENTVCDVSQGARAGALHAEDRGATVWISPGKHASYLNEALCHGGCGADRCEDMVPLRPTALINLGEPGYPMNGSVFINSTAWPLLAKMSASNFPDELVARLNQLPDAEIAGFNAGPHPAQGVIADSSATEQVIAAGGRNTTHALALAGNSTGDALSTASDSTGDSVSSAGVSTGDALKESYRNTRHALGRSARNTAKALHLLPKVSPDTVKRNAAN